MNNTKLFIQFCKRSKEIGDIDPALNYINFLRRKHKWSLEQVLWMCFLYACTYHLPSAYMLFQRYPDFHKIDLDELEKWWVRTATSIPFQIDKLKQRKDFVKTLKSYREILAGGTQEDYLEELLSGDGVSNFEAIWTPILGIAYFGRFSSWNWAQALKHVAGYDIEPPTLMLGEPDSRSFTDGLCYALGLEDRATNKVEVNGKKQKKYYKWKPDEKSEVEAACRKLKNSLGIDNFQLETAACAFKKLFRVNESRYLGYYLDRMVDDIKAVETYWGKDVTKDLWEARELVTPPEYRNKDQGVDRSKFILSAEQKATL